MPQAATRTNSSPGPGRGSARVITSAPKPGLVLARAFMTGASLFQYDLTAPLVKAAVRDETARGSAAVAFHERFASATVPLAGPDWIWGVRSGREGLRRWNHGKRFRMWL